MPAKLLISDETVGGERSRSWELELPAERLSVRELIRSRIYQEVQDFNVRCAQDFVGLIQPEGAEKILNGWRLKKHRALDWKRQFELALEAFEANQVVILADDRQVESLVEEIVIRSDSQVVFLRLAMLVGG